MHLPRLLLSALATFTLAGVSQAQPTARPGAKANVTLSISATSEYGSFLIKDSVIAAQESAETPPATRYFYQLNPLGHDPVGADPANYYAEKVTEKFRNFGSGENVQRLVTEFVREEVVKLKTEKFTNAQFIQELIDRNLVPITSPVGFKLVLVEAADRMDDDHDLPLLFFIENGNAIHYVGRETNQANTERDALTIDFNELYAESYNYKQRIVYKHTTTAGGVQQDDVGVTTYTETFSGTDTVRLQLFPGYYDEVFDEFVSTEGVTFECYGHLNYNGRYDAKNDLFLLNSAKVTNAAGGFESESMDEDYISGVASISINIAAGTAVADITPYLDALPPELAELKDEFLNHYANVNAD